MQPLYTDEQFIQAKSTDLLPCKCYECHSSFLIMKKRITQHLKGNPKHSVKYCSPICSARRFRTNKKVTCICCSSEIEKNVCEITRSKNQRFFCNRSCAAIYNNRNKKKGNRRSKLERWIETNLTELFPNLTIEYNKKTIGAELDVYIPSLNLAFELNGIFHYEPIFGNNKLNQIKTNDKFKSELCYNHQIDLCIIDTSNQKYFKPKSSKVYLDIIFNIIKDRLSTFSQK